jgi:hypothetical protein
MVHTTKDLLMPETNADVALVWSRFLRKYPREANVSILEKNPRKRSASSEVMVYWTSVECWSTEELEKAYTASSLNMNRLSAGGKSTVSQTYLPSQLCSRV